MKISVKSLVTFTKHFTKNSQDALKIKLWQSREICLWNVGEKVVKSYTWKCGEYAVNQPPLNYGEYRTVKFQWKKNTVKTHEILVVKI